jgi:hypothetical protein
MSANGTINTLGFQYKDQLVNDHYGNSCCFYPEDQIEHINNLVKCNVYWTLGRNRAIRQPLCFHGSKRENYRRETELKMRTITCTLRYFICWTVVRVEMQLHSSQLGRFLHHYALLGMWQQWYGKMSCQVAFISYGFVINCKILYQLRLSERAQNARRCPVKGKNK